MLGSGHQKDILPSFL